MAVLLVSPAIVRMDLRERVGLNVQRLRQNAGLSQEDLAERAGLSVRGVSDLERGARRAPHVRAAIGERPEIDVCRLHVLDEPPIRISTR